MNFDSPSKRLLIMDAIGRSFLWRSPKRPERLLLMVLACLLFTPPIFARSEEEAQTTEMASRILRGEKPEGIPIIYADSNVNILNWRQLRCWGISQEHLPEPRIIRFRDPTLWEEYKRYAFGVIALFIIQIALITGLILARREQQVVKRELDDRLRFEMMLSDLSADFLGLLPAEVDRKIQDWLQRLVEFLGVDRGAFLQFSNDGEIIHNTYRWVTPESDITAGFMTKSDSREKAPWYVDQLRHGVVLKASRWLEELPPSAVDERENGRRIGIKSHLAIPISFGGSVICAMAFSTVRFYRKWPPDLIARLNLVGEIFAGALSRKYADIELQGLTARLLRSQDDERRRIARELHDVTAQNLGTITINLTGLLQDRFRPSDVLRILVECRALSEQSLNELRTLSYLLHPPLLDQAGLVFALEWYIDGFIKRSGIRVGLVVPPDLNRLPPEVEMALFRVVQECLINIHRHSGSSTAEIRLERRNGPVVLEVKDQGCGLPANGEVGDADDIVSVGVGIPGMRQRLSQLGGSLEIETGEHGTTVTAVVPLDEGWKYDSYSAGGRS
jgi:signal transduction histidine kinase